MNKFSDKGLIKLLKPNSIPVIDKRLKKAFSISSPCGGSKPEGSYSNLFPNFKGLNLTLT